MKREAINIRKAEVSDASNLAVLKQQVWVATYAHEGIRFEYSDYLLNEFTRAKEEAVLNHPHKETFIAELNGHLIACLVIDYESSCQIELVENNPEIRILYVLEPFKSLGIGTALLNFSIQKINERGFNAIWLSAYSQNERALGFYKHFGFTDIGKTYFKMKENEYENRVLIFRLNSKLLL